MRGSATRPQSDSVGEWRGRGILLLLAHGTSWLHATTLTSHVSRLYIKYYIVNP